MDKAPVFETDHVGSIPTSPTIIGKEKMNETSVDEIKVLQNKEAHDRLRVAIDLNLPGTIAAIKGWKVHNAAYLDTWLQIRCGCSKETLKDYKIFPRQARHVDAHLFTLESYCENLPYGVMLNIQDVLSVGLRKSHLRICDPSHISSHSIDPLLIYVPEFDSNDTLNSGTPVFIISEWNKI